MFVTLPAVPVVGTVAVEAAPFTAPGLIVRLNGLPLMAVPPKVMARLSVPTNTK